MILINYEDLAAELTLWGCKGIHDIKEEELMMELTLWYDAISFFALRYITKRNSWCWYERTSDITYILIPLYNTYEFVTL